MQVCRKLENKLAEKTARQIGSPSDTAKVVGQSCKCELAECVACNPWRADSHSLSLLLLLLEKFVIVYSQVKCTEIKAREISLAQTLLVSGFFAAS